MTKLAEWLGHPSGRIVVDRTGLTGYYDIVLDWTPENLTARLLR